MLENIKIEDVLFLDIETVPAASAFEFLDPLIQNLWEKKSKQFRTSEQVAAEVYERAGIYSEFGKFFQTFQPCFRNSRKIIKRFFCAPITVKNSTTLILPAE
jgi:hypothetical protein